MDIITLNDNGSDSWADGEIVNDLTSKIWIERYTFPGEFTFKGIPTRRLRRQLALGTLISHTNSEDVMMVEDHDIKEEDGKPPELTITGHSLDSFMQYRIATDDNQGFHIGEEFETLYDGSAWPYILESDLPWQQAVAIIKLQLENNPDRPSFEIPYFHVMHNILLANVDVDPTTEHAWIHEDREIKRERLDKAILKIMDEYDGGIKMLRPVPGDHLKIQMVLHVGRHKASKIQFTYDAGELKSARYFWSNRRELNAAYVAALHRAAYISQGGNNGLDRRVTYVDASDIRIWPENDGWAGVAESAKLDKMLERRGHRAFQRNQRKHLIEATISPNTRYKYRKDYLVGDLVRVVGNYDTSAVMRVVEFTETEDETGDVGYPTLSFKNSDTSA